MVKITVGIVSWNSMGKLDRLLESFYQFHDAGDYKVILCDNG